MSSSTRKNGGYLSPNGLSNADPPVPDYKDFRYWTRSAICREVRPSDRRVL